VWSFSTASVPAGGAIRRTLGIVQNEPSFIWRMSLQGRVYATFFCLFRMSQVFFGHFAIDWHKRLRQQDSQPTMLESF
jgi:hypothetical protein